MKTCLTIAGSDPIGGAGIQADLKTFAALNVYGMSAITSVTAQNTKGVVTLKHVDSKLLRSQLDCVFQDIFPDSVKIGMIGTKKNLLEIVDTLKTFGAKNVILDPIFLSTSGFLLLEKNAVKLLMEKLFHLCSLVTPNIIECEWLLRETQKNFRIQTEADMEKAAYILSEKFDCAVLLKGGHLVQSDKCNDFFTDGKTGRWFTSDKIAGKNAHGTGCTLSSAICANLAKDISLEDSIQNAKEYLTGAYKSALNLGSGDALLNHNFNYNSNYKSGEMK